MMALVAIILEVKLLYISELYAWSNSLVLIYSFLAALSFVGVFSVLQFIIAIFGFVLTLYDIYYYHNRGI